MMLPRWGTLFTSGEGVSRQLSGRGMELTWQRRGDEDVPLSLLRQPEGDQHGLL
jgi:hypothetical protein